ncbi:hypothetical protein FRB93_012337 [Tulasnella sp. JGI-2019a]|nr:hypothetical protein FRB93_012337 [Tulasnella sp. JGI-2019a]
MPRVRKKTSKRLSIKDRETRKKKVHDGRKKNKKLAKKDVTWKSRVKKEGGMPNAMPFKDQIIAEMTQAKLTEDQERERKLESQRKLKAGEVETMSGISVIIPSKSAPPAPPTHDGAEEEEAPPPVDHTLPDLEAVLERADVVVQLLDVRDPLSFRIPQFEKLVQERGKKLILLLNKIDLVPREAVVAWTARLRADFPTVPFRSASAFLPEAAGTSEKGKQKVVCDDELGSQTLQDVLLTISGEHPARGSGPLTVAFVGITNSGKSSVINSLIHKFLLPTYKVRSSDVSKAPTTTLYPRAVSNKLEIKGQPVVLIDTPGFTLSKPESFTDEEGASFAIKEMLLRRRGRFERIRDAIPAVSYIVSRANTEDLMVLYNAPAFQPGDTDGLLRCVARSTGFLSRRGMPDMKDAASTVLQDWRLGKLAIYTMPPKSNSRLTSSSGSSGSMISALDDGDTFDKLKTLKEMVVTGGVGGSLVRFKPGGPLGWPVNLSARYEPPADRHSVLKRMRDAEEDSDDENMNIDEDEESDDGEDEDMGDGESDNFNGFSSEGSDREEGSTSDSESVSPLISTKRKDVSTPPSKKKVAFAGPPASVATANSKSDTTAHKMAQSALKRTIVNKSNLGPSASTLIAKRFKVANQQTTTKEIRSNARGVTSAVDQADSPYDFSAHFNL